MAKNVTYENRKAAGLCVRCGARLENSLFLKCDICKKKEREERERREMEKRKNRGGLSLSDVMKLAAANHCSYGEMVVRLRTEGIE